MAQAQPGANLSLVSEYSVRGLSLSEGRPSAQLRIDYDSPAGWYAGGFAARVSMASSPSRAQLIAYAGYARRLASGLSWDAGVSRTAFVHDSRYDYHEFHAGLASVRANVRAYFSPDYYGAGRSAYLEWNGFHPLGERLRLVGHAGYLRRLGGYGGGPSGRVDLRLALAFDAGDASFQLAWLARQREAGSGARRARALAASVSVAF
ncbi:TorF family putative porin [Massilia niastensis]|uniref:TorF family putative porin n=1 Tax=Massilia niastensis TaxID=544911 RepID=UPI00037B008C|nr:TorF family putative porin [Massilia niastensis]